MNGTFQTPVCNNCKHADKNDYKKDLALLKIKCTLKNEYKHKYARCDEHAPEGVSNG